MVARAICPGCGRQMHVLMPRDVLEAIRTLECYELEPDAVERLREVRVFRLHRTESGGICAYGRKVARR